MLKSRRGITSSSPFAFRALGAGDFTGVSFTDASLGFPCAFFFLELVVFGASGATAFAKVVSSVAGFGWLDSLVLAGPAGFRLIFLAFAFAAVGTSDLDRWISSSVALDSQLLK